MDGVPSSRIASVLLEGSIRTHRHAHRETPWDDGAGDQAGGPQTWPANRGRRDQAAARPPAAYKGTTPPRPRAQRPASRMVRDTALHGRALARFAGFWCRQPPKHRRCRGPSASSEPVPTPAALEAGRSRASGSQSPLTEQRGQHACLPGSSLPGSSLPPRAPPSQGSGGDAGKGLQAVRAQQAAPGCQSPRRLFSFRFFF